MPEHLARDSFCTLRKHQPISSRLCMSHTQKLIQRPEFLSQYPNIVVLRIHDMYFAAIQLGKPGHRRIQILERPHCEAMCHQDRNGADSSMALPCDI